MVGVLFKKASENNWVELQEKYGYQLIKVTGLNPPKANVNTSRISGIDGSQFNSSTVNQRNIVLTYKPLEGDYQNTVEDKRLEFLGWFEQNVLMDLRFKTAKRDAYISGYVESVEYDLFQNPELIQISIVCPESNFHAGSDDVATIQFESSPVGKAYTTVDDYSDCEVGFILDITASADISKIIVSRRPDNYATTDFKFQITGIQNGDKIHVNTNNGSKIVTKNGNMYFNGFSGMYFKLPNYTPSVVPLKVGVDIRCFNSSDQLIGASGKFTGTMTVRQLYRGL